MKWKDHKIVDISSMSESSDNRVVKERFLFSSIKSMGPRDIYESEGFMHYKNNAMIKAPRVFVESLHFDVDGRLGQVLMCESDNESKIYNLFWIDDVWQYNHEFFYQVVTEMGLPR